MKIKFVLVITAILLLAACSAVDQRQLSRVAAKDIQVIQADTVNRTWRTDVGRGSGGLYLRLNPVIMDNVIYAVDYRGSVTAVDRLTGKQIWREHIKQPITSGIAASRDLLLLGTGNGQVIALNRVNGNEVWQTNVLSEILSEPLVAANGLVYIKTADDKLVALTLDEGQEVWRYNAVSPTLTLRGSSTPFYIEREDVLLTGFSNGRLALFEASNGNTIWEIPLVVARGNTDLERMVDINVDPIVVNDVAYIASYQGHIMAMNLLNGDLLWRHELSSHAGILIEGNELYTTDSEGFVWAFDRIDGSVLWHQTALQYHHLTAPVVHGNTIAIGDEEGYVYWLDKRNGNIMAKATTSSKGILATPMVVNDSLYIFTRDGKLVAYSTP